MIIQRAQHLGMCFGVRDAIALAQSEASKGPLTVLGDLVHNETVLEDLRRRGVRIERQLESVKTDRVMITAHGASETRLREVHHQGHHVLEATCPLVRFAHDRVAALVRAGFHPVIIGQRDHVEVLGLTEDLEDFDVVLSEDEIRRLAPRARFGVAAQTTQPLARVQSLVTALRRQFPQAEVRFVDTVCLPTKQRQKAAEEIAQQSDIVIVVGGPRSNNTRELVTTSSRFCARVHHIQSAADLSAAWFQPTDRVGITAGTSTPDSIIDGIEAWLRRLDAAWSWSPSEELSTRTAPSEAALAPMR
ncbi:MAG: 4-hydroxy-3-methylbut-2-enyl diphosphate reductase [Verrucomicrobiales bacterium]|nr:4-hydroxy-3-methylbut-2-enyl diphosphate reductase [Verrucomicrobiales bacterium]